MSKYNVIQLMTGDVPSGWIDEIANEKDFDGFYMSRLVRKYKNNEKFKQTVDWYACITPQYSSNDFIKLGEYLCSFALIDPLFHMLTYMSSSEKELFYRHFRKLFEDEFEPVDSVSYLKIFVNIKLSALEYTEEEDYDDKELEFFSSSIY